VLGFWCESGQGYVPRSILLSVCEFSHFCLGFVVSWRDVFGNFLFLSFESTHWPGSCVLVLLVCFLVSSINTRGLTVFVFLLARFSDPRIDFSQNFWGVSTRLVCQVVTASIEHDHTNHTLA
jgi:hypothetical protein